MHLFRPWPLALFGGFALIACSSSSTGPNTPATPDQLTCLGPLVQHCCSIEATSESVPCVPTWASAQACGAWPAGSNATLFGTPCQGLTAVRLKTTDYFTFFVFDATSSALVLVGDNAAATDPSSDLIECGAGPSQFIIPAACRTAWVGAGGTACSAAAADPPHEWCADASKTDGG